MHSAISVAPSDLALAREFVRRLAEQVDPQFFTVTLFGSRARGDADEESDLDLFVALKADDPQGEVKETASRIACDLTLECGILVSAFVADREFLQRHEGFAFLEAVEAEGVPL
jgi:predicted nucleotidyltransferase